MAFADRPCGTHRSVRTGPRSRHASRSTPRPKNRQMPSVLIRRTGSNHYAASGSALRLSPHHSAALSSVAGRLKPQRSATWPSGQVLRSVLNRQTGSHNNGRARRRHTHNSNPPRRARNPDAHAPQTAVPLRVTAGHRHAFSVTRTPPVGVPFATARALPRRQTLNALIPFRAPLRSHQSALSGGKDGCGSATPGRMQVPLAPANLRFAS